MQTEAADGIERIPNLVAGCMMSCRQCIAVATMLTAEQYTFGREENRSIGQHLRHCIEHFQSLFAGLDSSWIDYDKRDRNQEVEIFPARFVETMHEVTQQLTTFDENALMKPLRLQSLCGATGERAEMATTLGRELAFLQQHIIHHLAIVKLLAQSMGLTMPTDLGVAFSTSIHRAKTSATNQREANLVSCAH